LQDLVLAFVNLGSLSSKENEFKIGMPFNFFKVSRWTWFFKGGATSGIPEADTFGRKGKLSPFGFRFWPPKLKGEYSRNSRKALDSLLFVHENIANVNYQW
jgi:hypothetical protein